MITKVQEVFSYTASGGSVNKTFTVVAPAAGNTLVLATGCVQNNPVVSVSGGGVTWTKVTYFAGPGGNECSLWIGPNSSGSGTTITVQVTNTYNGRIDCWFTEWSGMPATTSADGGSNNTAAPDPNVVTPSVTPTAGKPVLLIAFANSYTTTFTAGPTGGFTAGISTGSGYSYFAYQTVASASGSYQCGWTAARSYSSNPVALYAFDGSTGGGGSSPIPQSGWEGGFDSGLFHHGALNGGLNA